MLHESADGIRVAFTTPGLAALLMLVGSVTGFVIPATSLLVPLIARQHRWTAAVAGLIVGAQAAAGIAIAILVVRRGSAARPGLTAACGLAITAAGEVLIGLAPAKTVAIAGAGRQLHEGLEGAGHLAADRHSGGAPVREVLAVVAAQAVPALADARRGAFHRPRTFRQARARVLDACRTAAGEVRELDDPYPWRAVLADAAAWHLNTEMAVRDQSQGSPPDHVNVAVHESRLLTSIPAAGATPPGSPPADNPACWS